MFWRRKKDRSREPEVAEVGEEAGPQSADDVVEVPIDGVLDLHLFRPKDLKTLVPDYLEECRKRGITEVRIIHGKGTGALRKSVHALLSRSPLVADFRLCGPEAGGWGATEVDLVGSEDLPASS